MHEWDPSCSLETFAFLCHIIVVQNSSIVVIAGLSLMNSWNRVVIMVMILTLVRVAIFAKNNFFYPKSILYAVVFWCHSLSESSISDLTVTREHVRQRDTTVPSVTLLRLQSERVSPMAWLSLWDHITSWAFFPHCCWPMA